jgi:F420-non-reducing hydrogenase iron-sulfur subunit
LSGVCVNSMYKNFTLKITVFHCINTFNDAMTMPWGEDEEVKINFIKLPCSSMVKDVFLLRAFEAGADAVIVMVCPEGACRYVEGNLRAKRRVQRVQNVLDEIGLGSRRLSLFNVAPGDEAAVAGIIQGMRAEITALGPNPAHYISRLA